LTRPLLWLAILWSGVSASPAWAAPPLHWIPAVLHVHSRWSTGDDSLDDLAARAHGVGVEAIFLTENHLLRFEYGLPPLRGLLRYRAQFPSVLSERPEAFLAAVEAANARQREVLLIPGVQVVPHYFWTGSLLDGTLTMHDTQKTLLTLGLYRPEDYRGLPVAGNYAAVRWSPWSLCLLSPVLLVIPGVWLLHTHRSRVVRLRHFRITERRRRIGPGVLCLALAAILLVNNYPFRGDPASPYDSTAGLRPHQEVIDFVNGRGGVAVWSLPEARDHQEATIAGFHATIHTDPYPGDLLRTDRFSAFGGIYEDTTTFAEPGRGWDRLLLDYLDGRRSTPAWAVGESAYHHEGQAGKWLGAVQTVLLAERNDPATLLAALRGGRAYAMLRTREESLALDRFQVINPGGASAEMGARLTSRAGDRPAVEAVIGAGGGRRLAVETRLIRSGLVVHSVKGDTPVTLRWLEPPLPPGAKLYYRLDIRGPGGLWILSNPIFLETPREWHP
jgi:hypothetical protein